jgi:hypothetical protein
MKRRQVPFTLILLAMTWAVQAGETGAAGIHADKLVARLARPAPATIAFAEVRFSALLKQPTVVGGELSYTDATMLDRRVTHPYIETTEIRGESVRVVREGEAVRSFGLKRAPELKGLLSGFTALLSGNVTTIRQEFMLAASGTDDAWRLTLTPVDTRVRKRLQQILIEGSGDAPRCFTILNPGDSASVMLLGDAASVKLPADVKRKQLDTICSTPP